MKNNEITIEPVGSEIKKEPCFAVITDESTGKVIWSDGPFPNDVIATKAAERQAIILKVKEQEV